MNDKGCELCREHSGVIQRNESLEARCFHTESLLKPDGVVFRELEKMRKWMFWFWGSIFVVWLVNAGLTYKATYNAQTIALDAAEQAVRIFSEANKHK